MTLFLYVFIIFNIFAWLYYFKTSTKKPGFFIHLFPIKFLISKGTILSHQVIAMLIIYIEILILFDIVMILSQASNIVYIIFFTLIIIYEMFMLMRINSLLIGKKFHFGIVFSAMVFLALFACGMSFFTKSFEPLNIVDFWTLIVKISACLLIIGIIVLRKMTLLLDNIETVSIVACFSVFYMLQLLESCFSFFNYLTDWDFNQLTLLLLLALLLWSPLWLRKFTRRLCG